MSRGLETRTQCPAAPFFGATVENCDASDLASGTCLLNDGVTTVTLKTA